MLCWLGTSWRVSRLCWSGWSAAAVVSERFARRTALAVGEGLQAPVATHSTVWLVAPPTTDTGRLSAGLAARTSCLGLFALFTTLTDFLLTAFATLTL